MPNEEHLQKRLIIDTLIVDGIIFALLSIFFFFHLKQVPLGFLLGCAISILNHLILCFQADAMINPRFGAAGVPLTVVCYLTRFALYGVGLFLAFYLEHKGYPIFAWYTVFIGYMIIKAVIVIKYGKYRKKPETKNIEEKKI